MLNLFRSPYRVCFHGFYRLSTSGIYDCNIKISSLARVGKIDAARRLFEEMPERDVVSWNTMIAAYWHGNDFEESKRLFELMPERNTVSWNVMISGYIENGDLEEAFKYFHNMPEKNVASWNAMISGLVKFDRVHVAERLFREMPRRNVISYTALVDGLARNGDITRARSLFDRIQKKNSVSWAVMISAYVENEMFDAAKNLFSQMPEKNVVATTAMITGYSKEGEVENARKLFEEMNEKDLVSWNAMMSGYANNGHGEDALRLYIQMLQVGMQPDHSTLLVALTACSILTSLQCGRQIHATAVKIRLESNLSLCNAFITMYSKCGSINDSNFTFRQIQSPGLVSWNTIIAAFAQHGVYVKVCTMFCDLLVHGLKPDGITFMSILSACGHAGMVNESLLWFNVMVCEYKVSPRAEHFSCLVDIVSRAGQLERAYDVIKAMPFEADGSVWSALLGACRRHLNVELAELAARKLVALDSQNSGAYVMLSNIYAAAGMWREVTKVRGLMKEQGVQKQPGYSWIEIGERVHLFLIGDISHPDIKKIHSALEIIYLHIMRRNDDELLA
uniref:Pentatricopeptide repeat-containing protein At4g02750 n=1 Tax=Anthurium amnicola TaxID=1678845 RepID=A0A1D1YKG3_9ARAE